MSRIVLCVLLVIVICLTGCSSVNLQDTMDEIEPIGEPTPTLEPTQQPAQTSAPTPEMTPESTPMLEPTSTPLPTWQPVEAGSQAGDAYSIQVLDAHIPDVEYDSTSATRSDEMMIDEGGYLYFTNTIRWGSKVLYCYDQKNGSTKKITDDCACFTVNEGFVYYTDFGTEKWEGEQIDSIIAFDTATNTAEKILEFSGEITDFACHDDRLYFSSPDQIIRIEEDGRENEVTVDVLYSTGFDGGEIIREAEDVSALCFYGDRMFYISYVSEGGFFYELFADGTYERKYNELVDWQFGMSRGKAVLTKVDDTCVMYDIDTGKTTKLPFENYLFALLGQYVLYIDGDRFGNEAMLHAYDIGSGKDYELVHVSWAGGEYRSLIVCTTNDRVFLTNLEHEVITVYQVEIDTGDIGVSHVVTISE